MKTVQSELQKAAAEYKAAGESLRHVSWTPRRGVSRPWTVAMAAAGLVLLLGLPALLFSGSRPGAGPAGDAPPTFSGLLGSIIDLLPDGFDPEQAVPLLTLEGNSEEIASQYLETRIPTIGAGVARVEEQDGYTLVQWAWGHLLDSDYSGGDVGERGWLLLRPMPQGYEVIAATTDGVDLSDLTFSDGAVTGNIQSNSGEFLGADVLTLDGSPVDSAPYPDGFFPDAMSLWGTGGASTPPLALDIPVIEQVVVRVSRVGGTLLSISEVVLGGLPPETRAQLAGLGCRHASSVETLVATDELESGRGFELWITRPGESATANGTILLEVGDPLGASIGCNPPNEPMPEIWASVGSEASIEGTVLQVMGGVPEAAEVAEVTLEDGTTTRIDVQSEGYFLELIPGPGVDQSPGQPAADLPDEVTHITAIASDGSIIAEQ